MIFYVKTESRLRRDNLDQKRTSLLKASGFPFEFEWGLHQRLMRSSWLYGILLLFLRGVEFINLLHSERRKANDATCQSSKGNRVKKNTSYYPFNCTGIVFCSICIFQHFNINYCSIRQLIAANSFIPYWFDPEIIFLNFSLKKSEIEQYAFQSSEGNALSRGRVLSPL